MKKIAIISSVLLMVLSLCSCNKTDYQKVIPANAMVVMKLDVRSIAEKSEFQKSSAMKTMEVGLQAVVSGKDLQQVKEYIDDPMKMGIDLSMPIYAFMVDTETYGITMKMDNEDAMKDFLLLLNKQGLASKPKEKNGVNSGILLTDFNYTYDETTFLLMASTHGGGKKNNVAQQLMNLTDEDSFVGTEGFERMSNEEQDVVIYANLATLPANEVKDVSEIFPKMAKYYKDIETMLSLNFDKGEAQMKVQVYAKTSEVQQLLDEANSNFDVIEGQYLDKVSNEMLVWMGAHVKGEWLLKEVKENMFLKSFLFAFERAVDIEQMLKAVDGDVSLEVPMSRFDKAEMDFVAFAKLNNSKFLSDVADWKMSHKDYGIVMTDKGNNQYVMNIDGKAFNWGVNGDDLCLGTAKAFNQSKKAESSPLKPYEKYIKDSQMFIFVNMAAFELDKILDSSHQDDAWMKKGLGSINAIIMKSSSVNEMTLVIDMKNKNENFLKQLL